MASSSSGSSLPPSPGGGSINNCGAIAAAAAPFTTAGSSSSSTGLFGNLDPEKRKRNRTFIDPVSEVPRLEEWFLRNTHPSHALIARYTEELNGLPYRQKFPRLEQKNIQFWFKNRRAKCKRMNATGCI